MSLCTGSLLTGAASRRWMPPYTGCLFAREAAVAGKPPSTPRGAELNSISTVAVYPHHQQQDFSRLTTPSQAPATGTPPPLRPPALVHLA
jgi:hypothetical protein